MKQKIPHNLIEEYKVFHPEIIKNIFNRSHYHGDIDHNAFYNGMQEFVASTLDEGYNQRIISGFGEPYNVSYRVYETESIKPPSYIISDAGTFNIINLNNAKYYMFCSILLDEDYNLTDIIIGGCKHSLNGHMDYSENLSLLLAKDYIQTDYGIDDISKLTWVTDQTPEVIGSFFIKEGIAMQHSSHYYENKDFTSKFFIDGLCHVLLNNKDIMNIFINPEEHNIETSESMPPNPDYYITRNCVIGNGSFPYINQNNNINILHMKDMGALDVYGVDYNIFDKTVIGEDCIATIIADKFNSVGFHSQKCILETDIKSYKGDYLQLFVAELTNDFFAENVSVQTAFIAYSNLRMIAKTNLDAKTVILSHCPEMVSLALESSIEKLIVEDCPKFNIERFKEKHPHTQVILGIPNGYGGKAYLKAKNTFNQINFGKHHFSLFPYRELGRVEDIHKEFMPLLLNKHPYKQEQKKYITLLKELVKSTSKEVYQRYLNVEGVDFNVKHLACHNEKAGLPKYIISDGGFFHREDGEQSYRGAVVILDNDKNIHSVLVGIGRSYEYIQKWYHELFSLELALDYLHTEFDIQDHSYMTWITDQAENNITTYYQDNNLKLDAISFPSSTEAFISKILIDGFCHEILNDRVVFKKCIQEQSPKPIENSKTQFGLSREQFAINMGNYPHKNIHSNYLINGNEVLWDNQMMHVSRMATNTPGSYFSIQGTKTLFFRNADFKDLEMDLYVPSLEGNNFIFDNISTQEDFLCSTIIVKKGLYLKNSDIKVLAQDLLKTRMLIIENCPQLEKIAENIQVRILWIKGDTKLDLKAIQESNPQLIIKNYIPDEMTKFKIELS